MKIVPVPRDDDRLVAHRRDVRAAGRARAHHDRDLRDPLRGHARLVVEDPPEVLAVGEDLVLQRQEGAARVDEVDAGEVVLLGDLLRAQVLLDRERVVRAALHRRVVRDDHAVRAPRRSRSRSRSPPTAPGPSYTLPGGERVELEEGAARVDEQVDALARGELAAGAVPLERLPRRRPRATSAVRSRSSATSSVIRASRLANASSRTSGVLERRHADPPARRGARPRVTCSPAATCDRPDRRVERRASRPAPSSSPPARRAAAARSTRAPASTLTSATVPGMGAIDAAASLRRRARARRRVELERREAPARAGG